LALALKPAQAGLNGKSGSLFLHYPSGTCIFYLDNSLPQSFAICSVARVLAFDQMPRGLHFLLSFLRLFICDSQGSMPSDETSVSRTQKRRRCAEAELTATQLPSAFKKQRLKKQPRHKTPNLFWNNLSRQWLTSRALRKFNKKTKQLITPLPPNRSGLKIYYFAQLKRFAKHGKPNFNNLKAVK